MIFVFYILATLLVFFSYRSLRGGIEYLQFFREELAKPVSEYAPFVCVIVPCKGIDNGLTENLSALFDQEYADYELVFVLDDKGDPAVSLVEEISRKASTRSRLVIATKAINSSQKVENLREAVLHVATKSEVLVFVDSDARPGPNWLRDLVSPLQDRDVGAATGYRWFIAKRPSFAAALLSCWNASIASALGPNTASNFCWGGSTAVRWDTFEALKIREKWLGTVSDDFAVTRIMSEAGLPIVFVPQALTASIDDCSLREMLEFTTRQMKITRVYQPDLWLMSFLGSGLFCFVMLWSLAIIFFSPRNDLSVWIAILTVVIVSTLSVGKAYLRLKAVRTVLKNYEEELQKQTLSQLTLWLLTPFIFLANSVAALFSRRMTWRGIGYVMNSPSKTTVMGNSNER